MTGKKPVDIVVGSKNKVKIAAVSQAFRRSFPDVTFNISGTEVESGVSAQPKGTEETFQGARNRAENAQAVSPGADFYVGLEGGVLEFGHDLMAFAWMVVKQASTGVYGKAQTAHFTLPDEVCRLVRGGMELGHADDQVFGRTDSKTTNGACGLLTDDLITRADLYGHALELALIPFRPANSKLYYADPIS